MGLEERLTLSLGPGRREVDHVRKGPRKERPHGVRRCVRQEGHLEETDQVLGGTRRTESRGHGTGHRLESSRGKEKRSGRGAFWQSGNPEGLKDYRSRASQCGLRLVEGRRGRKRGLAVGGNSGWCCSLECRDLGRAFGQALQYLLMRSWDGFRDSGEVVSGWVGMGFGYGSDVV